MASVVNDLKALRAELFNSKKDFQLFSKAKSIKPNDLPEIGKDLTTGPSGGTFEISQLLSMGAKVPGILQRMEQEIAFISTFAGLRDTDTGELVAQGAHSGHDRLDIQMRAAVDMVEELGGQSRVAYSSGGCDGVWQGRPEMHYSLASRNTMYRNMLMQLGVYPNRKAVVALASCDKEGPAATAAVAHLRQLNEVYKKNLIGLVIPGGSMLPSEDNDVWDTGKVQTVNSQVEFDHMTREQAAEQLCKACTTTGGGCQFFGTAASQQVITEALGLIVPHGACVPSSTAPWKQVAKDSAKFVMRLVKNGVSMKDILTQGSIDNAVTMMAASGASTNMFMHVAFIARAAGLRPPSLDQYKKAYAEIPRILRVLPNGPKPEGYHERYDKGFPTAMFWAAGGVPEVMLKLRDTGLLKLDTMTVSGASLGEVITHWEKSERRKFYRELLLETAQVHPDDVILSLDNGVPSAMTFPHGNLCDKSVCKSSSINPDLMSNGVYNQIKTARVFSNEVDLRSAILNKKINPDDIICFVGRGFLGSGLEEVYEFTAEIANIPELRSVAIFTDARFSGVTTGACIGHATPEGLAGGPCGKLLDGDQIHIYINSHTGEATVNLVGDKSSGKRNADFGNQLLSQREVRPDLSASDLPEVVKTEALLAQLGGEDWLTGYYPDPKAIINAVNKLGMRSIY